MNTQCRKFAVSAWQEAGEWQSTGVAFDDFARMQTYEHKLAPYRKLETPEWAVDDSKFRELLVSFLEERASLRPWQRTGTHKERLERAQKIIMAGVRKKVQTLDGLCREYVELKRIARTPEQRKRLRILEIQIEGVDTQVRCEGKDGGAALVTGIVYHFYRLGGNSVATGEAVGCKPPLVRQTLWRLRQTWSTLETWRLDPSTRPAGPMRKPFDAAEAVRRYQAGKSLSNIVACFGCNRELVREALIAAGVYEPRRPKGYKNTESKAAPARRLDEARNEPVNPNLRAAVQALFR